MSTAIRFVGYHPPSSVQGRAVAVLADRLQQTLGEAVDFSFEPDIGRLGRKAYEILDLVEDGTYDLCYFYSSYLADRVPEFALFELPFEIAGRAHAYRLLDGAVGRAIAQSVERNTGYKLIAYWDNGLRHLSNGVRAIRSPEDCRGLTIRTARNEVHQAAFRALGFDPVFIDVKDLPEALAAGRIDAQENPLTNIINYGIERYHPHITLTAHLFGVSAVLANRAHYDAWPDAVRDGLEAAMVEATAAARRFAAEADVECARHLTENGAMILEISAAERARFAAAVAGVIAKERTRFAPELLAELDA